jgi:hypothetical protein
MYCRTIICHTTCIAIEWKLMLGLVFVVHSQADQCSLLPFFGVDTAMAAGKPKSKAILKRTAASSRLENQDQPQI